MERLPQVAYFLQADGKRWLPEDRLQQLLGPVLDMESFKHLDFGGRSLLNRNSEQQYRFAHYSIQEFLLVNALMNDSLSDDATCLGKSLATAQMWDFLCAAKADLSKASAFYEVFDCTDTKLKPYTFLPKLPDKAAALGVALPKMTFIPPGSFVMGQDHSVTLAKPFLLACYPVTFAEYDAFAVQTGRRKPDDWGWGRGARPVIGVTWQDAQAYCEWLSAQCGHTFRLPSEAEWEYACRAGTDTEYFWGDDPSQAERYAWLENNSKGKTQPVGEKQPNPWGLYDMVGNVWEWQQDIWHEAYQGAPNDGSAWEVDGDASQRVLRGGSWHDAANILRPIHRFRNAPDLRNNDIGFRLARTL
ncbi:formylglycine-generating enzyme family protein [Methylomonas sp. HYX-M1]|uniref:formylglycine-generating enzyme family protein n=1 Tax=Methylomonas sp. HYX-M1 TaxID=3139307 RepID=UPI00345BB5C9